MKEHSLILNDAQLTTLVALINRGFEPSMINNEGIVDLIQELEEQLGCSNSTMNALPAVKPREVQWYRHKTDKSFVIRVGAERIHGIQAITDKGASSFIPYSAFQTQFEEITCEK